MPSVFERYALGRRPAPGRGRGRSAPPTKKTSKKPQLGWNAYLTDSSRYKLPPREQARRTNAYNFCGPVQPKLPKSPKKCWHRSARRREMATPERRPVVQTSSAATIVDVFDLLADSDAVGASREEAPPTVERRTTVRRLFAPKRRAAKKADPTLLDRVADLEKRLELSEARAARFASQLDAMGETVALFHARDLARAATQTPPPAPTTTTPPPSTPPPPPSATRHSLESIEFHVGADGCVVDDFLAERAATGACPPSPEPPRAPPACPPSPEPPRAPPAPTSAPVPPPPLHEEASAPPHRVALSGWSVSVLDVGPSAPARPRAPSLLNDSDDEGRVMPIW